MDIVTRLKQFMDYTQLPSSQFADLAQIPRPTLSQIMNGRNKKISNELIAKLHEAFPQLNVMWLMFGDGDMVNEENIQFSEPQNEQNLFTQPAQQTIFQQDSPDNADNFDDADFVQSTQNAVKEVLDSAQTPSKTVQTSQTAPALTVVADKSKKIASIMVFYTDQSFERFEPVESSSK
jgi:transcriptional regulator with XRE-family HTH domain